MSGGKAAKAAHMARTYMPARTVSSREFRGSDEPEPLDTTTTGSALWSLCPGEGQVSPEFVSCHGARNRVRDRASARRSGPAQQMALGMV